MCQHKATEAAEATTPAIPMITARALNASGDGQV